MRNAPHQAATTTTTAYTMKHRRHTYITCKSQDSQELARGSSDSLSVLSAVSSYYSCFLLCWARHVERMPIDRMPRKILIGWVEHARPVGCPEMTWGRTLNKTRKRYDLPTNFGQWSTLAADRMVRQQRIGIRAICPRPATTLIHDKWRELFDVPT